MKNYILQILAILIFYSSHAQDIHWTEIEAKKGSQDIFRSLLVDKTELNDLLLKNKSPKLQIQLPSPDGGFETFLLTPSQIMAPGLAAKFPGIKTFNGKSIDGKSTVKIDYSESKGLHAMIFSPQGTIFIDPNHHNEIEFYNSYYRRDYKNKYQAPEFIEDGLVTDDTKKKTYKSRLDVIKKRTTSGTELRKYRLSVSADNEYSAFHGDTKDEVMAAIVTSINRVTGIYENDVAVTFELVENNDLLIFLDPDTDPFNGASASAALDINQEQTDNIIGTENYDIGHIFTTGSGGLAGLGVVCSASRKAEGTTGTSNPTGDPFDVDYVAHEIGHQFAGNHTFNGSSGSCSGGNRNGSTAYEPGSGTTIMAYAGICGAQNIQNNSDAFFHAISIEEMVTFTTVNGGNDCAVVTETGNTPPVAVAPDGGFSIPLSTPFELEGSATDEDEDNLTYSWEQWDLGPSGAPNEPVDEAPLFRSFLPTESPIRQFPQNSDLISNTQTQGELLPDYERDLNFRLVVRDNNSQTGGVDTDDISFSVDGNSGPFVVTSQSSDESYYGDTEILVEWDVANTDASPINCSEVMILLSTDGGQTFPNVLTAATNNDGSEFVMLPLVGTENARVKVKAVDNIFFNINSSDFTIVEPTTEDFVVNLQSSEITVCSPENAIFEFTTQGVFGFSDDITWSVEGLASELSASFSNTVSAVGTDEVLTISNIDQATSEEVTFNLIGTSGELSKTEPLTITIINDFTSDVTLSSPENGSSSITTKPTLNWEALDDADSYSLQVSTESDFSSLVVDITSQTDNFYSLTERLEPLTQYYWRVQAFKECDHTTEFSEASFTTGDERVLNVYETDLGVIISEDGTPTVTSSIMIDEALEIVDINVIGLNISHTYVSDLTVTLISPSDTEIQLFSGICDDSDDVLLGFDDDAIASTIACPATDSITYQPAEQLATIIGENTVGEWILRVEDGFGADGGSINAWGLEFIYTAPEVPETPTNLEIVAGSLNFVDIRWEDNSEYESGFIIQRAAEGGDWITIDSVFNNFIAYSDRSPLSGNSMYRVAAYNSAGVSDYSEPAISSLASSKTVQNLIKISPNPGSNVLNIQNKHNIEINSVQMVDLTGKVILNTNSTTTIDTSSLLRGIYIVKIVVNNHPTSYRWVKK